ncbi:MAG: hypothetical protein CME62_16970 [Halobacteriovoraceae bacterium]|nr:hypothetical protein [Halobacteriovoraceae bacterium]|tara:strand:+ start:6123 stop:6911 length:789 start_codon:yes stop_codon:yes gene_type:complete
MQSGGAGVGSLLINETTLLNPASIVFLPRSTFNYQKNTKSIQEEDDQRDLDFKEGLSELISIQDTSTQLKGGLSYTYQNGDEGKRKRLALSSAGHLGKDLAMGIIYKYTQEESEIIDNDYHQFTLGFTQVLSENMTFGLIIVDPFNKIPEYSHALLGVQYNLNEFIQFLADVGSGDNANLDKEAISKLAIQINSFEYFYFRYGRFHDKYLNEKGASFGLSWVGPKFSVDYAIKNAEIIEEKSDRLFTDDKFIETSFAVSILF